MLHAWRAGDGPGPQRGWLSSWSSAGGLALVCWPRSCAAARAGSGKSSTLEGTRGIDTRGGAEGDGLVHLAIDALFELVRHKAVAVGERRRPPAGCLPRAVPGWARLQPLAGA